MVSSDLVVEIEKRLLQITEHQERWEEHTDTVKDIFTVCMEQFMEELIGTLQQAWKEMLGALNEVVDWTTKLAKTMLLLSPLSKGSSKV